MNKTLYRSSIDTMSMGDTEYKSRRSMADYSDVQSRSYDPDFISIISNQMQVPDTIPALNGDTAFNVRRSAGWGNREEQEVQRHDMNVPERIIVAGGGGHIGAKPEFRALNFDDTLPRGTFEEPVELLTPPRTLTMDEQFPSTETCREKEQTSNTIVPNGTVVVRESYTTVSSSDSLMMNEGEIMQFRTQIVGLSKRLASLEKQQDVQVTREKVLYTAAFGYLVLKFCYWFFRSK